MSSCLSFKAICISRHMAPIPSKTTPHYLYGNPLFMFLLFGCARAAMPSSTAAVAAAAVDFIGHRQPVASSQQEVVGTCSRGGNSSVDST